MVRRLQLLDEPERRSPARRWSAALVARVREGLLRDNKVLPAVLGALALLIFAWLVAGLLMGGSGEEQQASKGAALSQAPKEGTSNGGSGAPGTDNRDAESFAAYTPKDPFRQLFSKAGESTTKGSTNESTTGRNGGSSSGGSSSNNKGGGSSSKGDSGGSSSSGSSSNGGGASRGGSGGSTTGRSSQNGGGGGNGGSTTTGGNSGGGPPGGTTNAGGGSTTGGGGNGDLFNSGGDLPAP